jgi:competence protein ComEC
MKSFFNGIRKLLGNIVALVVLSLLAFSIWSAAVKPVESGLFVRFLSVGQGDAELIQTPSSQNILIDGGPDSAVVSEIDKFLPFYGRNIDTVVLTHPHADHVAGLVSVLNKYQVKNAYISGVTYSTSEYIDFLNLLKSKNVVTRAVKAGDSIDLGENIKLDFLFPLASEAGTKMENINNSSVVTRLRYGDMAALFMGDLESEGQASLLASGQAVKSDLYKVPHHGSKDSINTAFLAAVRPKYAIIEVGNDNKFGHPTASALTALSGIQVFRTDQEGTISFEIGQNEIKKLVN